MITQEPDEYPKSPEQIIADEIFEYADERVGHAENVAKDQLIFECYHKLGKLMAEWAKKMDKLEKVGKEPDWLGNFFKARERKLGVASNIDSHTLGFAVDHLFFARENENLSDDLLLVSEPHSMLMEDFKNLIRLCENNGLDFYVDGFNTTLPGRTFRLSVYHVKHGTTPLSRLEFREKTMFALQLFEKLSTELNGKRNPVETKAFVEALLKTGKFERDSAEKIVTALIESGQVPNRLIIQT